MSPCAMRRTMVRMVTMVMRTMAIATSTSIATALKISCRLDWKHNQIAGE